MMISPLAVNARVGVWRASWSSSNRTSGPNGGVNTVHDLILWRWFRHIAPPERLVEEAAAEAAA